MAADTTHAIEDLMDGPMGNAGVVASRSPYCGFALDLMRRFCAFRALIANSSLIKPIELLVAVETRTRQ
jgi:hypothetical protein